MLFRGTPEHAARLEEVVRLIDVPEAARGIDGAPQLEVYPITTADPQAVLEVLKTLLEGDPIVNLATDTETGHLVAFAPPPQQATIRATIDQMQRNARQVAVITLSTVDPQVAVLSINKLFGGLDREKPDPKAPRVDADITTRSLLGPRHGGPGRTNSRPARDRWARRGRSCGPSKSQQHVRLLPLTGSAARSAIVTDRADLADDAAEPHSRRDAGADDSNLSAERRCGEGRRRSPAPCPAGRARGGGTFGDRAAGPQQLPFGADAQVRRRPSRKHGREQTWFADRRRAGPGGVLIASDDLEALDDFEELLTTVAERSSSTTRDYAVFYLKYGKAANIAEVLTAIFGGSKSGGIVGDMAGAALGDLGGGLMGNLLLGGGGGSSAGGGSFSSGTVEIVPDVRLNALIVRAKPADLDTVEQLLRVLDQRVGPEEVEADARPRLIPVYNTQASTIVGVVQQIYSDRMATGRSGRDVAAGHAQNDPRQRAESRSAGPKNVDRRRRAEQFARGAGARSACSKK